MLGQRVNNYEIVKLLGEGGMGAVYEAEHRVIRKRVAIKVLKPELVLDRELVQRFFNEARATSAIHHPNIVEIIDVGVMREGVPYLVMELLEGENLCDRIARSGKLEIAMAVDIAIQAASALEAAHLSGIVHRDLKPENLFIGRDARRGHDEVVKVLDFGIAKLRDDLTTVPVHTLAGAVLGTPPYMSPEQCRGRDSELDQRTDIYSLGIILYEAICGAPPFLSDAIGELLMMHMSEPPHPPSQRRSDLSPALEAVILKALEKQPSARFQSMAEFGSALATLPALDRSVDGEHALTPAPAAPQPDEEPRRVRLPSRLAYDPLRAPEFGAPQHAHIGLDTTRPSQPERADALTDASSVRRSASFAVSSTPIPSRKRTASYAWLWALAIPMAALAVGDRPGPRARLTTRVHAARTPDGLVATVNIPAAVGGTAGPPPSAAKDTDIHAATERARAAGGASPAPTRDQPAAPRLATKADPQPRLDAPARQVVPAAPQHRSPALTPTPTKQQPSTAPPTATSERITGARFGSEVMPAPQYDNPYRTAPPAPPPSAAAKARADGVEPGYLSLDTTPWSEVFLGDAALGTTPLIHVPLPPGKHLLTLRNSELSTSTTYAVDIQSGQTVSRLIGWGK